MDDILLTDELASRIDGTELGERESQALLGMAKEIAVEPHMAFQRLAEAALAMTDADAAGVSVVDQVDGEEVFRWRGVAGDFKDYLGHTMPRWASPCGDVLRTGSTMLMLDPGRHYASMAAFGQQLGEVLLVPFRREGTAVGTVWAICQPGGKQFRSEDARILQSLSDLAATAHELFERLSFGNSSYVEG